MRSQVNMNNKNKGFSLMELLIAIAIIAILLGIGLPVYNNYTAKAKFSELLQAVAPYKTAADMAVQLGTSDLSDLDAGSNGIPNAIGSNNTYYQYVAKVELRDGVLQAQARGINSDNEPNYILNASINSGLIQWQLDPGSSCLEQGLCSQ